MAEPTDALEARREAAELLGLDLGRPICPADNLKVDLVLALRRVIDAASESVLDGSSVDISRLVNAVDTLTSLLPKKELAQREDDDWRERLWTMYKTGRDRAAAAGQGYDGVVATNEKLTAEIEALRAELAALRGEAPPEPGLPVARADNVLSLPHPLANSAPAATPAPHPHERASERSDVSPSPLPTAEQRAAALARANAPVPESVRRTNGAGEPWRSHMNRHYDPWADNRE